MRFLIATADSILQYWHSFNSSSTLTHCTKKLSFVINKFLSLFYLWKHVISQNSPGDSDTILIDRVPKGKVVIVKQYVVKCL